MKKLSITIMAHPSRADLIPALQKAIGGDVPVVFDEKQNVWDTCRRAWLAHDMSAEYGLVIQDDAIVCDNFRERAEAILNRQERDFITAFYVGKQGANRINQAIRNGEDHFIAGFIYNEVALCMKTKHIERMIKFCDDRSETCPAALQARFCSVDPRQHCACRGSCQAWCSSCRR